MLRTYNEFSLGRDNESKAQRGQSLIRIIDFIIKYESQIKQVRTSFSMVGAVS